MSDALLNHLHTEVLQVDVARIFSQIFLKAIFSQNTQEAHEAECDTD